MEKVRLSVRKLVEFVLKGGSLDNRFGGMERALEGARIHRRLQKQGGKDYQAEVMLQTETEFGGFRFVIEGRADGILEENGEPVIDEIKTTGTPLELVGEDFNRLHWAQVMCYGYFFCLLEEVREVTLRLTYCNVDSGDVKRFYRKHTLPELEAFYFSLLELYKKWADWQKAWLKERNRSIASMAFPFPQYRAGQREMAVAVFQTVKEGGKLFCQAPTGIGKTVSTLFPSVKAMGEGLAEKIFYLTAKTITRQAAGDALNRMAAAGLRLKSVTLTAKDKICFQEERFCNPDGCPYADGHFDRVNDAVYDMLTSCDQMGREEVEQYAKKHTVCPFELALDLTDWCDCVICDYNYLFDPTVHLRRFFSDGTGGDYVFLIDEAHNLADRARSMYSASLSKKDVLDCKRAVKQDKPFSDALGKVNSRLLELRKACEEAGGRLVQKEKMEPLLEELYQVIPFFEAWLNENRGSAIHNEMLEFFFVVLTYLNISELYDDRFTTFAERHGSSVTVRQLCLDPALLLRKSMEYGRAAVLFSATLLPIDYFVTVLGGDEQDTKKYLLPSPFEPDRLGLFIAGQVCTKYARREAGAPQVAELIARTVRKREGNYIVYFPSYQYLRLVYEVFAERYPQIETCVQESGMAEGAREEFLARFEAGREGTLAAFCVLGGVFSEGVDLSGERLIGSIIVGVGLPQIGAEQDVIRDYYNERFGMGFEFAYQYPGMNKVLQAAGRVIRGEEDRGVVLLIDERFQTPRYRSLFPEHWAHVKTVLDAQSLDRELESFWNRNGGIKS